MYIILYNQSFLAGMYHSGLGLTHVNNLLAAMEVPGISARACKRHEGIISEHAALVTKESLKSALEEEMQLSAEQQR